MRKWHQLSSPLPVVTVGFTALLVVGMAVLASTLLPLIRPVEDFIGGEHVELLYRAEGAFPLSLPDELLLAYASNLPAVERTAAYVWKEGTGGWVLFLSSPDRAELLRSLPSDRSGVRAQIVGRYLVLSTLPLDFSRPPENPLRGERAFRSLFEGGRRATSSLFVRFPLRMELPPGLFSPLLRDLSPRLASGTTVSVLEYKDAVVLRFFLKGRTKTLTPLRRLQVSDLRPLKREGGREFSVVGENMKDSLPGILHALDLAAGPAGVHAGGTIRALIDRTFGEEFSVVHDLGMLLSGVGAVTLYEDEGGRRSFAVVGRGVGSDADILLRELSMRTAAYSRGVTLDETMLPDGRVDRRLRQADAARVQTLSVGGHPLTLILDEGGSERLAHVSNGSVRGVGTHSQALRRALRFLLDSDRTASREALPQKSVGLLGIVSGGIPLFGETVEGASMPILRSLSDLSRRFGDFSFTVEDRGEVVTVSMARL